MNFLTAVRLLSRAVMLLAGPVVALSSNVAFAAPPANTAGGRCTQTTPSGLGYSMLRAGTGAVPGAADKVSIGYKGTLASDGSTFDASEHAEFGVNEVIPGFSEGLMLVKVGGRIRLCIPAALAYGARGAGKIPANADLVFEVDLLAIKAPPGPLALAARACASKSASGLGFDVVKAGAGAMPGDADVALINYKGYVATSGAAFDDAGPVPVPVGQVIPGFAEGLKRMQRGGSYKLCIPPPLGYGDKVVGPIPANSTLVFLIDMIDFKSLVEIEAGRAQPQQ